MLALLRAFHTNCRWSGSSAKSAEGKAKPEIRKADEAVKNATQSDGTNQPHNDKTHNGTSRQGDSMLDTKEYIDSNQTNKLQQPQGSSQGLQQRKNSSVSQTSTATQ